MVVERAPLLDQEASFLKISEPFPVQAYVPQLAIEAFNEPVVPGLARRNECRADPPITKPVHDRTCGEFGTLVGADVGRLASPGTRAWAHRARKADATRGPRQNDRARSRSTLHSWVASRQARECPGHSARAAAFYEATAARVASISA